MALISFPSERLADARYRYSRHRLVDAGLVSDARAELVRSMAVVLVVDEAFRNDDDAIASLRAAGFPLPNVFLLVADARQAAMQTVISTIMAD